MNKLNLVDFKSSVQYIDKNGCGVVYPLSIAEMVQSGDIFTSKHSALFWHYSGFAFIYGDYSEHFLNSVYEAFLSEDCEISRRFILFVADEKVQEFFLTKDSLIFEKRYFFEYQKGLLSNNRVLPANLKICEINNDLFDKIRGNVTPLFSWCNSTQFLKNGKGYCIVDGENVAAWAFTAAISSDEIDIGVETRSDYRYLGLGTIVAEKMIQYCLQQHKRPVWACHANNLASQKLANKIGFERAMECYTIRKS